MNLIQTSNDSFEVKSNNLSDTLQLVYVSQTADSVSSEAER